MSRALSTMGRLALFLRAGGRCQACGWLLAPGTRWEVDHILPRALGGRDAPDNLQVLCRTCHAGKTARQDAPALAKTRRLKARHLGATRPRSIMPGSRRSRWKKGLDGRVALRPPATRSPPGRTLPGERPKPLASRPAATRRLPPPTHAALPSPRSPRRKP
jgi:5-methylcytosine-specific restriction protein A